MSAPHNLIELLRVRAHEQSDQVCYVFLHDGERAEQRLSYGELDARARAIGARLQAMGAAGERVLLLFPPGLDFVAAFFGCLYAGAVAVPAAPPRPNRTHERLESIAADSGAALALTDSKLLARVAPTLDASPVLRGVRWASFEEVAAGAGAGWVPPRAGRLAYLQYTSGSTALPKGVMVSHSNALHNAAYISHGFEHTAASVSLTWLPHFHDMGLIDGIVVPLFNGFRAYLMPPSAFLQRPARWLEAITRYGVTHTGGPNFAYELCVRRTETEQRAALDLSSWEVAYNGAEPVRHETIEKFVAAFAPHGFRRGAFHPAYGLAETTLKVTGSRKGEGPVVCAVQADALQHNRVALATADAEDARVLVSSGRPALDTRVVVVNPDSLTACGDDEVGEVWVSSPSVADGYWGRPEQTAETFGARLADTGEGPFLRTGDLGFMRGGELFVTGRLKDLIIVRGLNHYPQDIERAAEESHAALRAGGVAAFALEVGGEERLALVQEVERHAQAEPRAVIEAIRRAVGERHEVQPYAIALVKAGSIPKTSSGKIQRHACRAKFLRGDFEFVARWQEAAETATAARPAVALVGAKEIEEWLVSQVAARAGVRDSDIDAHQPLARCGIDSLAAVELTHAVETAVGVALPMTSFLQDFTVAELAAQLSVERGAARLARGEPGAGEAAHESPLSYGQRSMWFMHRLAPLSPAYNISVPVRILSRLDEEALRRTFSALVRRHASLRTTFSAPQGGEPVQRVRDDLDAEFRRVEAGGWTPGRLREELTAEARRPFDLEEGPLLRVSLYRHGAREYTLLLVAHHIVADFWSLATLMHEMGRQYEAETGGRAADLPPLAMRYTDFVRWQLQGLAGAQGERLRAFWGEYLGGELPALDLPTDRPRPAAQTFNGAAHAFRLSPRLTRELIEVGRARGATLYMTLLAAFQVLLHRYTGQEDITVGSPTSGRTHAGLAGLVGYFVNPVVLRADLSGDPPFEGFLRQTRARVLAAFEHQDYPFPLLVEQLQPERDPSRPPLFQVMFAFQKSHLKEEAALAALALGQGGGRAELGALTLESVPLEQHVAQFEQTLTVAEDGGGLAAALQYNTDLFDAATVERMAGHFVRLLEGIAADPSRAVSDLPLLTEREERRILREWNDTATAVRGGGCLHELFERRAAETPHARALVAGGRRLTYGELNARANQLAHHLRRLGVGAEARVGVCLSRTPEMLVALLGVLKAGGAYVPLDPEYPRERLSFMLEDAGVAVLLTQEKLRALLPADARRVRVLCLDEDWGGGVAAEGAENPAARPSEQNLAYVIYTSGSTGRPKGVAITHGNAATFLRWAGEAFGAERLRGVLAATSICFDLSVFELFAPLSFGGEVILAENVLALPELETTGEVTLVNTVPSAMAALARSGSLPPSLRTVNLAGEALPQQLVRDLYERGIGEVFNLYGPSEDTTYSTYTLVENDGRAPHIGRPISNTRAYVLDARMRPAPAGVPGELYLGGDGLARGYLGRPDLTAERFVPDPFGAEPGARLYRTGDRARWLPDGNVEFLGRADNQVKVRGFRVELGEVEAALRSVPGVRDCAVAAAGEGASRRLVAYVVGEAGEAGTSAETLRARLRESLPEYMIPSAFMPLGALPLTPNGKVDRKALPEPEAGVSEVTEHAAPAHSPVEEVLAGIWAPLLGVRRPGAADNFFESGGHSLLATQVVSRVNDAFKINLPLRSIFEAPTLGALAERITDEMRGGRVAQEEPLRPAPRDGALPLSYAQQRLWFLEQLEPGDALYNMAASVRLTGRLDAAALAQSFDEVVRRHEVLRTTFAESDGRPRQIIAPSLSVSPEVISLEALAEDVQRAEVLRLAGEEARRPFDLTAGPLLRARLLRLRADEHVLLVALHHIASDGWSVGIFLRELSALYGAFARGDAPALPDLPVQYADYAAWQRRRLEAGEFENQIAYWRRQLAGAPAVLALPTDRPRPAVRTPRGETLAFELPAGLADDLRVFSRRESVTLFMTLLAAFYALLRRYTGESDISVGTPVALRNRVETEALIGFFVNTLVVRADLSGDPSFGELLARVREAALGAYAHQDAPFEKLVEELEVERSLSYAPLFQVMFALNNTPQGALELSGLKVAFEEIDTGTTKFDLTFSLEESGGGLLRGAIKYSTDLFDAPTVERLARHYERLLAAAVQHPEARVSELPLMSEDEERQLLHGWNRTAQDYPRDACLHELFEAQVARTPGAVAVAAGDERVTYAELDARAERLARRLRGSGVRADTRVGVCAERSIELLVGVIGALKAGAAFLPIDPEYPRARIAYMLGDAGVGLLLTQPHLTARLPESECPMLLLSDEGEAGDDGVAPRPASPPEASSARLAYVIYTSGSTGEPKGVMVSHRAIVNHLTWRQRAYPLSPADRFMHKASFSFDIAVWELFAPLLSGARVVMAAPGGQRDSAYLVKLIAEQRVSVAHFGPTMLQMILHEPGLENCHGLRQVFCGGEPLTAELRDLFFARTTASLHHQYGPTEATVDATIFDCPRDSDSRQQRIPIGRPISNTRAYVLDARMRPAPVGVSGELHLGGDGLARGYLGRPDLTADRFVPDPFGAEPGARLYRTGDLCRLLPDGNVEFLGRADNQVKLRGFRVELGEVEAALRSVPGVRDCAVAAAGEGEGKRLVAYVVVTGEAGAGGETLRARLRESLPEYMIPSAFVPLDALPLTPNGKVDYRTLPEPEAAGAGSGYVPPRTGAEEVLASIWADALGVEAVGVRDNFFDLGGHSLLAMRVISRVRQAFGVELPLRSMFESPTVAGQAEQLELCRRQSDQLTVVPPVEHVEHEEEMPLSYAQERMWFLWRLAPDSPAYNIAGALRLRGHLDHAALESALSEAASRHEPLRTTFSEHGGRPRQTVSPPSSISLPLEDLSALPPGVRDAEALRLAGEDARRPFDLTAGPLLRAKLLRLSEGEHVLLVAMHHIVSDGWSVGVFLGELTRLYAAFSAGLPSPLTPLPVRYADYAAWQRRLPPEETGRQLAYWRDRLAGVEPLELPTDRKRPAAGTDAGGNLAFTLPPSLSKSLVGLSRREGVTPHMLLLAAFKVLLARYTGQRDVAVGTPVAGRGRAELEGLVGLFVNTLVLRVDLSGDPTFGELLGRVREAALGAYAHQDVPFERVVEEFNVTRSLSQSPLFQVMFAMNTPRQELHLPGLEASPLPLDTGTAKFDLTLTMGETRRGIYGNVEYKAELFEADTIRRLVEHFQVLLADVVARPDARASDLRLMSDDEQQQLLAGWSAGPSDYPRACVHRLFEGQAAATPDAVALRQGDVEISYRQLDGRAGRLARRLRRLGVGPESYVGLLAERGTEAVVAMLAVLKAGGAYVPLDPSLPPERMSFVIEDAGLRLLLCQSRLLTLLPPHGAEVFRLDSDWYTEGAGPGAEVDDAAPLDSHATPDSAAYVMYTSGSTGVPKGVVVTHLGVSRLARGADYVRLGPGEVVLQLAPLSFDASTFELWGALVNGACLDIFDGHASDLDAVARRVEGRGVTTLWLTAGLFHRMLDEHPAALAGVRQLLAGGDVLSPAHVARLLSSPGAGLLVNGYGPTENTTFTCCHRMARDTEAAREAGAGTVPIGRPVAGTRVYILDGRMRPAPVGVPGELYAGGDGLARGYLGRPDLTAERFVPDPFSPEPGARLYRTGDLCRFLPDGNVEFLGRADNQVKLRGFRVEPGEVEATLCRHESVGEALVVSAGEGAGRRLVAYVVAARGARAEAHELREYLKGLLPEYMIPSAFVPLDALPLTPNGKVDHRALPEPEGGTAAAEYVAPRTEVEEAVAAVWRDVLDVERVGAEDNFFDLGGHSLLATQLISSLREVFHVEFPLRELFESPTVAELSRALTRHEPKPGQVEKIARRLNRINSMSAEELDRALQGKR